ncbi:MAG: aminodeoxychorismate synthase component I [Phycisphaerae bacterium]
MLWKPASLTATVISEPLDCSATPAAAFEALLGEPDLAVLESAAVRDEYGRFTVLACRPLDVLTLRGGDLSDAAGRTLATGDDEIWRTLSDAFAAVDATGRVEEYCPGWIGYVGYELGRHIERLPATAVRDTVLPDLRLAFHDAILLHDSADESWRLVELLFDSPPPGAGQAADALRGVLTRAQNATPPRTRQDSAALSEPAESNFSPDAYRRAVQRCLDYIAAGDIFQVNLSQRLTVPDAPPPEAIYRALRDGNPAAYAAYLDFESAGRRCAVAGSSPELFMRVRDEKVETRPIKGTRRRPDDPAEQQRVTEELLSCEKDNAELAMIIDLLRNDLGRVCRYGSVRVAEQRRLEVHPTVLHLVGTVRGRLRGNVGPAELLRATFPGGSITGAPKIRAMEIIDELEPHARGVYTGCVGIVGVNGSCEWNIAIRTVVWEGGNAHVQVGGGIVADSTPQGEYRETLDKARAMLRAIAQARRDAAAGTHTEAGN